MIFYHPGKPGEVSHEAARAKVADILGNPFTRAGRMAWRIGYESPRVLRNARRPWVPAGAMATYLEAAAMREATQGEG